MFNVVYFLGFLLLIFDNRFDNGWLDSLDEGIQLDKIRMETIGYNILSWIVLVVGSNVGPASQSDAY